MTQPVSVRRRRERAEQIARAAEWLDTAELDRRRARRDPIAAEADTLGVVVLGEFP